jgi:hypothetical protein
MGGADLGNDAIAVRGEMSSLVVMRCRLQFLGRGLVLGVAAVVAVGASGCRGREATAATAAPAVAGAGGEKPQPGTAVPEGTVVQVDGKLLRLELEGGFWGIVTPAGEKLRLVAPPPSDWVSGTSVRARIRRLPDGPSLQQWGVPVELLDLARAPIPPRSE